jgi:glycolate dehydrogenase FAD-binding subunit
VDLNLDDFATSVRGDGPVTIAGLGTRGGGVPDVRCVNAPSGIVWVQPAEMTMMCGAGTPIAEVEAALAEYQQQVALPVGGTIGGALAVGQSGIRRLGYGAMRDSLLQAHYINAEGDVVKAGGPTVKNVSGFDLCRLLIGSRGTLGFLADVILRTRPKSPFEQWFTTDRDPWELLTALYRPTSMLWNGSTTWVLLEGDQDDVDHLSKTFDLTPTAGPPDLPTGARWSMPAGELESLRVATPESFVAEIGVGIVHHSHQRPARSVDEAQSALHRRIKREFDRTGRLNPGIDVLSDARVRR